MKHLFSFRQSRVLRALVFIAFSTLTFNAVAQDFAITNGTETTCAGVFFDDGLGAAYGVGQSYTFTICPDTPGDVISIDFSAFSLFQSPNPNNSDYLSIFDGDNTGESTLGDYTGTALQGTPVTGTVANTTGCLTFVFNSSPNGGGAFPGWEGTISCTTPCDNPTAASQITDPAPQGPSQSIGVCLGAPITFSDIGSTAAPGFTIANWIWDYGDGSIDVFTSAQDAVHTFDTPGEYIVKLAVQDNNGCQSLNIDPLQVLVSTIPIFNTNFDSPVCLDEVHQIDASPIQSVTWTALPPQVAAGETYLADGAGFSYSSTLTFDFFEPGATLDDCDDLESLFINMEHSYLGDLGFSITCPDGTLVDLLTFATNQGGGTYLGEPVDDGFGGTLDQGVGYDYGWSTSSTAGAIWDNNWTSTTYTNNAGATVTNNIVDPGFYESEEDLCNLVGCPLNGDWTFSVSDNLGADNGYIFAWGINFNPALFPDVTTFTPVVGLESDSSWWEGPNVLSTSVDGNIIDVNYDTPGFYDYTYFATNNFGCTFDTTITVEAMQGPEVTAGPDQIFCVDPVQLQAGVVGNPVPTCGGDGGVEIICFDNNENLLFTFCPDNPGDGITAMQIEFIAGELDGFNDNITVYNGDDNFAPWLGNSWNMDLSGLIFTADLANNPTGCITLAVNSDGANSCATGELAEIEISVTCIDASNDMVWSWAPPIGLSDVNAQTPLASVTQTTEYTVTGHPIGFPGCTVTDEVVVALNALADPGLDTDTVLCYNSPISFLVDYLDGTPAIGGEWTDPAGNIVPDMINPTDYTTGANFVYTYTVGDGNCVGQSTLDLTVLAATNLNCCQTNAVAGDDVFPCAMEYELQAEPTEGIGTWSGPASISFSDIHDPQAIATCNTQGGEIATLTWTDDNGFACSESDEITITFSDPLELMVVTEDALCHNQNSGTAIGIASGGTTTGGAYLYQWGVDDGHPGIIPQTRDSLLHGTYQVKVLDDVGCIDSTTFVIGNPAAQEIFVTQAPPNCANECSGRIGIRSEGAVEYSFDGGLNFSSDSTTFSCAGEYTVIARNPNGCEITQAVTLIDPLPFEANFHINPLPTTTRNTHITFQDISTPGPIQSSLFEYGNDPIIGEGDSRISSFTFPKDTSGTYPVTLITTNVFGCTDTLTREVIIYDDLLWYIPNSFTPNEDGINDIWHPVGNTIDINNYELTIVDRWGRQVFHTTDYNRGWNGSSGGNSSHYLDAGVYNYLIKVSSLTSEEKREITGFITLIR